MSTTQTVSPAIHLPVLDYSVLQACSFPNWYQLFSHHTFRSTIIPLDQDVVDYLQDGAHGLHLPQELNADSSYTSQLSDSEDELESEKNSQAGSSSSRSSSPPPRYSFPELTHKIAETIQLYDGSVFPKLNWSAPQDASFLLVSGDGPLRCRSPMDVYMVLKGSDCIFHDLDMVKKMSQMSAESTLKVVLVLREWFNLNPAHEFRCFVRNKMLVAVSSRSSTYYDFLLPKEVQQSIVKRIQTFFLSVIAPRFSLSDYIFDVYLKNPTKLASSSSAIQPSLKLVDINPFASYIDPCLFSYDELDQYYRSANIATSDQKQPTSTILRVMESEHPHQNFRASKFQLSKIPKEFIGFSQDQDIKKLSEDFQSIIDCEST